MQLSDPFLKAAHKASRTGGAERKWMEVHRKGESTMNCVHLVVGPTGAGKTDVATEIADERGAPIVVADRIHDIAELAERIAVVHHDHSLEQHQVFTRLFGWNHE
jgi:ATP-dependent protease Clp ATPase subunit